MKLGVQLLLSQCHLKLLKFFFQENSNLFIWVILFLVHVNVNYLVSLEQK